MSCLEPLIKCMFQCFLMLPKSSWSNWAKQDQRHAVWISPPGLNISCSIRPSLSTIRARVTRGAFHFNKWNSTYPKFYVFNGTVHSGCTDPTKGTPSLIRAKYKHYKRQSKAGYRRGVLETTNLSKEILVQPVKVDHLQSWPQIFSDQTEMVRSIWWINRNYWNFMLNEKRPGSRGRHLSFKKSGKETT